MILTFCVVGFAAAAFAYIFPRGRLYSLLLGALLVPGSTFMGICLAAIVAMATQQWDAPGGGRMVTDGAVYGANSIPFAWIVLWLTRRHLAISVSS